MKDDVVQQHVVQQHVAVVADVASLIAIGAVACEPSRVGRPGHRAPAPGP